MRSVNAEEGALHAAHGVLEGSRNRFRKESQAAAEDRLDRGLRRMIAAGKEPRGLQWSAADGGGAFGRQSIIDGGQLGRKRRMRASATLTLCRLRYTQTYGVHLIRYFT